MCLSARGRAAPKSAPLAINTKVECGSNGNCSRFTQIEQNLTNHMVKKLPRFYKARRICLERRFCVRNKPLLCDIPTHFVIVFADLATGQRVCLLYEIIALPFGVRFYHCLSVVLSFFSCPSFGLPFYEVSMCGEELKAMSLEIL